MSQSNVAERSSDEAMMWAHGSKIATEEKFSEGAETFHILM